MKLRPCLAAVVAVAALARHAPAQASAAAPPNPVGVWRGVSTCQVRSSPCHDEVVVYRITRTKASDTVSMDARKIVNGQEDDMGVLGCRVAERGASLTCAIPRAVWRFTVRGDSLVGELRLTDSTKFRDVRAARSR